MKTISVLLVLCSSLLAQPDAPSRLWTRENKTTFAVGGALVIADSITTQNILNHGGRETNPLARPLVKHGWPGQIAASSIGFFGSLGLSYALYRTGHPKLASWVPVILVGVEAAAVTNNLIVEARE